MQKAVWKKGWKNVKGLIPCRLGIACNNQAFDLAFILYTYEKWLHEKQLQVTG